MKLNSDLANYHLNQSRMQTRIDQTDKANQADKADYNKNLKEACEGFEEIFVHKLIQVMRNATDKETLLNGGRGEEIFQDMLDENYAKLITRSKAMGLSNLIFEQTKKS